MSQKTVRDLLHAAIDKGKWRAAIIWLCATTTRCTSKQPVCETSKTISRSRRTPFFVSIPALHHPGERFCFLRFSCSKSALAAAWQANNTVPDPITSEAADKPGTCPTVYCLVPWGEISMLRSCLQRIPLTCGCGARVSVEESLLPRANTVHNNQ